MRFVIFGQQERTRAPEQVSASKRKQRGGAQPERERRRAREARERCLSANDETLTSPVRREISLLSTNGTVHPLPLTFPICRKLISIPRRNNSPTIRPSVRQKNSSRFFSSRDKTEPPLRSVPSTQKRFSLSLQYQVEKFERESRKIEADWNPGMPSPIQPSDLGGGKK